MSGRKGWHVSGPVSFETIRSIGLQFPHVRETTMYGKPALKIRDKMFACVPSHRSAEPDSLVIRVDFAQRGELLAADPEVYYVTDHYKGYTAVLVRLARVQRSVLEDLLRMAYRFVTAEASSDSNKKGG
jgi:hypothetical protein